MVTHNQNENTQERQGILHPKRSRGSDFTLTEALTGVLIMGQVNYRQQNFLCTKGKKWSHIPLNHTRSDTINPISDLEPFLFSPAHYHIAFKEVQTKGPKSF
jgi:hypothetical protein